MFQEYICIVKDIADRKDIELLVDSFYKKVLQDETIGHFFTEVAKINLEKHMPKMYDFWETTLFHTAGYKGNPMAVHKDLNEKSALEKLHFDTWIAMFKETVDELFAGVTADLAKQRAQSIAMVMQLKIGGQKSGLL